MNWEGMLELGGWIIAGFFVILGMFGVAARTRRAENDGIADNLITNLQRTTEVQKTEITELNAKREAQALEIAHLNGRIQTMMEILQGRDPMQSNFFKESPKLFEYAKNTDASIKTLADSVEKLVEILTPKTVV